MCGLIAMFQYSEIINNLKPYHTDLYQQGETHASVSNTHFRYHFIVICYYIFFL